MSTSVRSEKKKAVVVSAIDGLATKATGVGTIVFDFVEAFHDIALQSRWFDRSETHLICLSPEFDLTSTDTRAEQWERVNQICRSTGGFADFYRTTNGPATCVFDLWRGSDTDLMTEVWHEICRSFSEYLNDISFNYDELLVFIHDANFCLVRRFQQSANTRFVWISHSLGSEFDDLYQDVRKEAEAAGIPSLVRAQDYFGFIGKYYERTLLEKYKVPAKQLIPFINEIRPEGKAVDPVMNGHFGRIEELRRERKVIFTWGRCCFQKGFDFVVPGISKFLENDVDDEFFAVFLTPFGAVGDDDFQRSITDHYRTIPSSKAYIVTDFDPQLPSLILSSRSLEFVVFGSRFEGFSVTSLEALWYAPDSTKFLHTNIPAHIEAFEGITTAIPIKSLTSADVVAALESAGSRKTVSDSRPKRKSFAESYANGFDKIAASDLISEFEDHPTDHQAQRN